MNVCSQECRGYNQLELATNSSNHAVVYSSHFPLFSSWIIRVADSQNSRTCTCNLGQIVLNDSTAGDSELLNDGRHQRPRHALGLAFPA